MGHLQTVTAHRTRDRDNLQKVEQWCMKLAAACRASFHFHFKVSGKFFLKMQTTKESTCKNPVIIITLKPAAVLNCCFSVSKKEMRCHLSSQHHDSRKSKKKSTSVNSLRMTVRSRSSQYWSWDCTKNQFLSLTTSHWQVIICTQCTLVAGDNNTADS